MLFFILPMNPMGAWRITSLIMWLVKGLLQPFHYYRIILGGRKRSPWFYKPLTKLDGSSKELPIERGGFKERNLLGWPDMKVILELQLHIEPTQTHRRRPPERRHAEPECEAEAAAKRGSAQCDSAQRWRECGGFGAPGAIGSRGKHGVLGIVCGILCWKYDISNMLNLWYIYLHLP